MVKNFEMRHLVQRKEKFHNLFKTDFGWHILQVDKIRGQEVDIRHILLTPKIEANQLRDAKKKLDSIRKRLIDNEINFKDAALAYSDEKETKFNGGILINPQTGDTRFELTNLDPTLYSQIRNLEDEELSQPLIEEDRSGLKKYKILKVSNRYDEHVANYSLDYSKIKSLALKEKQLKAIQKWMDEKIESTYVNVNRESKLCSFTNNWVKN